MQSQSRFSRYQRADPRKRFQNKNLSNSKAALSRTSPRQQSLKSYTEAVRECL